MPLHINLACWVFCPEIKQKDRTVKAKTPEALFCWGPIQRIFPDVMCLSSVLFAGRPSYLQGVFIIFYWSLWIFMIESYNFRAKVMSVAEVCRPLSIFQSLLSADYCAEGSIGYRCNGNCEMFLLIFQPERWEYVWKKMSSRTKNTEIKSKKCPRKWHRKTY